MLKKVEHMNAYLFFSQVGLDHAPGTRKTDLRHMNYVTKILLKALTSDNTRSNLLTNSQTPLDKIFNNIANITLATYLKYTSSRRRHLRTDTN